MILSPKRYQKMSLLLALFIGIGISRLLVLPTFIGILIGFYIYSTTNHKQKNFFHWDYYRPNEVVFATFHHHLFSLMGYLAKADGVISKEEIAETEAIISELGLNYSQKSLAKSSFKAGANGLNLSNTIAYLKMIKYSQPRLLERFFAYQERVIHADHHSKIHQINILNQIKFRLYQTDQKKQQSTVKFSPNHLSKAYKALGINPKMSYPEMKKTYQRLVGKNHPDRAKTELDKQKAEAYLKSIQAAWKTIKNHHKETA